MSMAYYAPSSEPPQDRIGRLPHFTKTLYPRVNTNRGTGNTAAKTDGRIPRPLGQRQRIASILNYDTLNPL